MAPDQDGEGNHWTVHEADGHVEVELLAPINRLHPQQQKIKLMPDNARILSAILTDAAGEGGAYFPDPQTGRW